MKTIEEQITEKEARRQEIFKIKKPLDLELGELYEQIEKLKDEQTKIKLEQGMTFEEKLEYYLFEDDLTGSSIKYDECVRFFMELGLYVSGYYTFSNQQSVELMLRKGANDNLEQTFNSVTAILPFVKPCNKEGDIRFRIFEHTLSEYGIYDLRLSKEGVWSVVKTTYGREETQKVFEDLYGALEYCQEYHYYESSEDNDEDYDDY